jgi:hypothetical protein
MWMRMAALCVVCGLCLGVSCTITGPGGGWGSGQTALPLDQVDATIYIDQTSGGTTATVTALLTDSFGRTVSLSTDQEVSVNGQPLSGPDAMGQYTAAISTAGTYTITVREPTRGVQTTAVAPPVDFEITAPAAGATASLSGFTLAWSNAQDGVEVRITLTQTFGGSTELESFGPFVDGGSRALTAADVRDFVQGVDLSIEVTKAISLSSVAGLDASSVTARVTATSTAAPGP